jgi:hypothetical protein
MALDSIAVLTSILNRNSFSLKGGKLMSEMISFCGLLCNECPAYIATQTNDDRLREKVAKNGAKCLALISGLKMSIVTGAGPEVTA